MDPNLISKFARIGARVKVVENPSRPTRSVGLVSLDIRTDRQGEFFEISPLRGANVEIETLDVQPSDRHLLLLVRENREKNKFLCGHDERHWFVAGVPESAPVGTVRQAKEALKPVEVRLAQDRLRIHGIARNRRKNDAYVRQGEWFFIPQLPEKVDELLVRKNEPLARGNGGKPHWAEFCYRTGGLTVYVCGRHPSGVMPKRYQSILAQNPKAKSWNWRMMVRNPSVYVRGRIRHSDHKTVTLRGWHLVRMNTENESRAMRNVAFLD
jgi:hypothetical protein